MNPNDVYLALGVLTGISMATGVILWKTIGHIQYTWHYYATRNNFPRLQAITDTSLCKEPHSWEETKLVMAEIPFAQYKVCSKCGFVSGTNYQLNKAGIQQMNETMVIRKQVRDREERQITRFSEILEADREMWIKTFVGSFGHNQESNEKLLRQFSKFTVESMDGASQRAIKELQEKK